MSEVTVNSDGSTTTINPVINYAVMDGNDVCAVVKQLSHAIMLLNLIQQGD